MSITIYGIIHVHKVASFARRTTNNSCTDWGLFYYNTCIYHQAFPSFSSCYTVRYLFRWPSIESSYQIQKLAPKAFTKELLFASAFIHTLSKVCWEVLYKMQKKAPTFHMETSWKLSWTELFHFQTNLVNMCVVSYMYNLLDYILLNLNRCNCTQHSST